MNRLQPSSEPLPIDMSPAEYLRACERGRLFAAEAMRTNPESRKRVEKAYGKKYCMKRWPEAYRRNQ